MMAVLVVVVIIQNKNKKKERWKNVKRFTRKGDRGTTQFGAHIIRKLECERSHIQILKIKYRVNDSDKAHKGSLATWLSDL